MESELIKLYRSYSENKRLADVILYGTAAFTLMNGSEKAQHDKFRKKQKKNKKKIFKIIKQMSDENNI